MGKNCPACFYPRETRVIVQYGSKVHSFRLLKDCPNIVPESTPMARLGLARRMAGEMADPEEIVSLVLDEPDRSKIYRCGGPGGFEPVAGKYNYWVTDIAHRDRTAPRLSAVRDAWEYNYQIYPNDLIDSVCNHLMKNRLGSEIRTALDAILRRLSQPKTDSPHPPQDDGGNPKDPKTEP
ncbi:MAG: hypothetical protein IJG83_03695 [Thermoguttaceae bacterium]|nr:hypothetical protein [Thermoguttaceae bacterium]MBQ3332507.1 hypothetical protein [Thermoguttaceae bacterium]MBQ6618702.1 hypothetical protein [Thermoguttaceae bacterium]MBR2586187.1 hypothetical protein [Thermoguttaceae bacterium]